MCPSDAKEEATHLVQTHANSHQIDLQYGASKKITLKSKENYMNGRKKKPIKDCIHRVVVDGATMGEHSEWDH